MAYSVIDKVYTIFIDVMTGSSNGYGKPTFYNTDSHTSFIELTVTNGSKEFNMTEFSYMFTVEKPDGTKYTNEYTTQDKSKLVIPVDAQMISCTGNCNAQLYVNKEVDGVNKTLTMVEFNYTVYKGLHEGLISESVDFDNVYVKILNKLDYIINNGADLTGDQAAQLAYAYQHSKSPHAPANIVETMHTEIGEAIDAHHKKVALSASQVGSYRDTDITIKPSNEGLTENLRVKGRTMQNIFPSDTNKLQYNQSVVTIQKGIIAISPTKPVYLNVSDKNNPLYKTGTDYTVIVDIYTNTLTKDPSANDSPANLVLGGDLSNLTETVFGNNFVISLLNGAKGRYIKKMRTQDTFDNVTKNNGARLFLENTFNGGSLKFSVMILEGDYTQEGSYIPPYFEGIKSVGEPTPEGGTKIVYGSCGKNLFDGSKSSEGLLNVNTGELYVANSSNTTDYIKVEKGKNYVVSGEGGEIRGYYGVFYDCSKKYVAQKIFSKNASFTFEQDGYFRFSYASEEDELPATNIQLEEGTEATAYEPYQEDIKEITASISGGLKGIIGGTDDVAYINPDNGQVWIEQNIGHYTSVGNEVVTLHEVRDNTIGFTFMFNVGTARGVNNSPNFICNYLGTNIKCYGKDVEGCFGTSDGFFGSVNKSRLETPDLEGVKKYIRANFKECYYQLDKPKYVKANSPDILNLKTFNGATHVFSKQDFKPTISFNTDFVPLTSDAKQYCTADGNKSFILPDIISLQDSNALEIHLFVKMLANATLSFPSNILWNDLAKMNEIVKGSTAEFIFTYIKTADGGSWLGTVVPHK